MYLFRLTRFRTAGNEMFLAFSAEFVGEFGRGGDYGFFFSVRGAARLHDPL
jgi:hypothetical protein